MKYIYLVNRFQFHDQYEDIVKRIDENDANRLKEAEARLESMEAQQNNGQGNQPGVGDV